MKDQRKYVDCCVSRLKVSKKHAWYFAQTAHSSAWHYLSTSTTEPTVVVRDKVKSRAILKLVQQLDCLGFTADFSQTVGMNGDIEVYDLVDPYCLVGRDS